MIFSTATHFILTTQKKGYRRILDMVNRVGPERPGIRRVDFVVPRITVRRIEDSAGLKADKTTGLRYAETDFLFLLHPHILLFTRRDFSTFNTLFSIFNSFSSLKPSMSATTACVNTNKGGGEEEKMSWTTISRKKTKRAGPSVIRCQELERQHNTVGLATFLRSDQCRKLFEEGYMFIGVEQHYDQLKHNERLSSVRYLPIVGNKYKDQAMFSRL